MSKGPVCALRLTTDIDLESLRQFTRKEIIPESRLRDRDGKLPWNIYQELHRMGWLQCFIPIEFGGSGLATSDLIWIARTLAYGSAGVFTTFTVNMGSMLPVILYGTDSLKKKLCEDSARRFSLWSFAMTEPDVGSNLTRIQTSARKVDGGYVLNGKKCFISNGSFAEHIVAFAKVEDDKITAFYLPGDAKGLSRGRPLEKLGQRDSDTSELYFDEVFVPAEHRIGAEGQGLKIAFHVLQRTKTMIAAGGVGICDRAHDLVSDYLDKRILYGTPLLDQPVIHHFLAQLHSEVQAAWLLASLAAATWDSGSLAVKEASMAKLFSSHTAVKFVSEALELFGSFGYTREYEIEKLYRDVRVLEIYEGPTFVQQQLIARELFPQLRNRNASNVRKIETYKKAA